METKIFCFQDSICLKDTKDATISDELQISFIYSPDMIMTVIKIIITIKVIVTVATNCWVFNTSQVYLQNNLEKRMLFLTSQKGKLKFREKRYYLKQLRHGSFPGYFHVQHTIYVSIQFLEKQRKKVRAERVWGSLQKASKLKYVLWEHDNVNLLWHILFLFSDLRYHLVQSKII